MYIYAYSVEGYDGCAVGVHDRQDNRIGRASVRAKEGRSR
jgi:hypothetical protein